MFFSFSKYQGTGNDFILIDDRNVELNLSAKKIQQLCDRKFGIGADGLILLRSAPGYDFSMKYFNSDGRESSMCGNGGRCITAFARELGIIDSSAKFLAADGPHEAKIEGDKIRLGMKDVLSVELIDDYFFLDTGSPHVVKFVNNIQNFPLETEAKKIRFNSRFAEIGTNVNFVEVLDNTIFVRTYERGVEGETLSCGTGVTASALATVNADMLKTETEISVITTGGKLSVGFTKNNIGEFTHITLAGPTAFVYEGRIGV